MNKIDQNKTELVKGNTEDNGYSYSKEIRLSVKTEPKHSNF